jgi:hypothetical protein
VAAYGLTTKADADVEASIRVKDEQIFLMPAPDHDLIRVIEVATVYNAGGALQDVRLPVPNGYQALEVVGVNEKLALRERDGLVLPKFLGGHQTKTVTYSYLVLFKESVQMVLHTVYPVDAAHVYLPIGKAALSAEGLLTTTQTVNISGTSYREFTRLGIPAGDDWTLSVQMLPDVTNGVNTAGLPDIGHSSSGSANTVGAVANLALAALVFVIGLLSIRRTQSQAFGRERLDAESALLRALFQLDKQHETGSVSSMDYQARRRELMSKLVTLRLQATQKQIALHTSGDKVLRQ